MQQTQLLLHFLSIISFLTCNLVKMLDVLLPLMSYLCPLWICNKTCYDCWCCSWHLHTFSLRDRLECLPRIISDVYAVLTYVYFWFWIWRVCVCVPAQMLMVKAIGTIHKVCVCVCSRLAYTCGLLECYSKAFFYLLTKFKNEVENLHYVICFVNPACRLF